MKKLVLFDIDGTLVRVEGISRHALIQALRNVYGKEGSAATYSFAGKMDGVIIYEVMRESGMLDNHIGERFEEVKQTYIDIFKQSAVESHVQILDGVISLLEELANHNDVVLGLLTGNFEDSGRHKLELSGINHYFPFGAFAEDGHERIDLPEVAVERAYRETGKRFSGKDVVIIGDTEHDVRCAKVLNSKCIAVATGHYSTESLEAGNPDHVVENLSDIERIKTLILSD